MNMPAFDALDVIHVFFEDDLMVSSKEEIDNKNRVRSMVYEKMYDKPYKYGVASTDQSYNYSTASDGYLGEEDDAIRDPVKPKTKSYIPPTDFSLDNKNPFGKTVEPPLE